MILSGAAAAALAACVWAAPPAHPRARNVILISIDDLRADRAYARRKGKPLMPKLDAWAAESVVFEDAFAQAPWTLPSMMSAFTSLYPHRHKILNRFDAAGYERRQPARLAPAVVTLAQALKDAGFDTAAFTGDAGLDGEFGFSRGFDVYYDSAPFAGFDTTTPMALAWLKERKGRFFLFVHGYDAHGQGPLPAAGEPAREEFLARRRRGIEEGPAKVEPVERAKWEAVYDRRAASADERVGRLLDALRRVPGLLDETAVVVIADHGEELYEHGRLDHGMTLFEEVLRVPLIVRAPGVAPARARGTARLLDLAPTVLDLLGVRSPAFSAQAQGVSLVPALGGAALAASDSLAETDFLLRTAQRALRAEDGRKMIFDLDTLEATVYDLKKDPGERKPLALPADERDALMSRLRALMDVPPAR